VLVSLGTDLGKVLNSNEQELITSITSGGSLIGAIIAGMTSDKYGRKLGLYLGCFLFVIGAIIQAASFSLAQMTVGRFIVGLGVGSAAMIIPLYIGEIAPARSRGRLIVFDNLCVAGGQLVSYALGAGFTNVTHGWRYMVGLGAIPAILLSITLPLCPESPRQLISHGKVEEAKKVLKRIFPQANPEQVSSKIRLIERSIDEYAIGVADKTLWWQFKQLVTIPSNLRALTTACAVMASK
jgi:SP family myo-inositol transporter-like MFS transporter 13